MKFILRDFQITILLFFAICSTAQAQEIKVSEWKVLEGHKSFVLSIAFSPDGNILASGSIDKIIKLWSVEMGIEIKTIQGHQDWVRSVSFSPDGSIFVSGSEDRTIKIWETVGGTEIKTIKGHKDFVSSVSFSPDGKILASGSGDGTIKIWSTVSGKEIVTLKGHSGAVISVAFKPDGTLLASGSSDGTIKLWSPETGREIRTMKGHSAIVNSVVFSPDGTILASGSNDGTIKLWSPEIGREIRTFKGHSGAVNSVVFSPDGTLLASGSHDGKIKILKIDYHRLQLSFWDIDEIIVTKDKEGAKQAVYSYALELKDVFIPPSMPEKERNIDDLRKPKGEFETEALYRQRLKRADSEELRIKVDNERVGEEARLAFDKRQTVIRSKIERLLPITREEISVTFEIGKYNAEEETFPIFVEEIRGTVSLLIPISDAPGFKLRAGEHKATVTTQMNIEGEKDYLNLYVTDTKVYKNYYAVTGVNGRLVFSEEKQVKFETTAEDFAPPRIIIEEPSYSRGMKKVVREQTLTVRGKAIDESGIHEVLVNGAEAQLSSDGSFWADVRLRVGENKFVVIAEDMKGNRARKLFTVIRESSAIQPPIAEKSKEFIFGDYHALVIAVQDYTYKSVTDLDYPIQDAKLVMNTLIDNYTFERKNVHFLENPDRSTILKKFTELRRKLTEDDNLLIFYAGHGYWDEDERQGYWLPRNADWNDRSDWLSNDDLRNKIRALNTKHTLLISDACFSGGIFKVRDAFIKPDMSIQKIYEMPSRKALTSGALKTVPDKSVFVEYLVKRLKNNREKYLYSEKLYVNMKDAVINNSPTNQTPQFGVIGSAGDEGGDFVFVRR